MTEFWLSATRHRAVTEPSSLNPWTVCRGGETLVDAIVRLYAYGGATIATTDRDFMRFSGLKIVKAVS